jgi:pimeloyl-ACP methyl ester carboxylesterase
MDPTYSSGYTSDLKGRFSGLKLLFIPFDFKSFTCFNFFNAPKYIPALLHVAEGNQANITVIHFHGNACDIGEVGICAQSEGYTFMAHYLVVEFPRFGIADGFPSEPVINQMAFAVYEYVVNKLNVPHDRIVIVGRSIGTGPACFLGAHLESQGRRPAAVVLHAPYCSLRSAAYDLLGCFSYCFLDRWENWQKLFVIDGTPSSSSSSSAFAQAQANQRISLSSQEITLSINGEASERTHKPPRDALSTVIGCPVLFIHADNDKIIDVHHSETLHRYRQACGLPSSLFIQKSTDRFTKGHNFFHYGEEVVIPIRDFLYDNVPTERPHSLPLDVVDRLTLVPSDLVAFESARQKNCSASMVSRIAICPCVFGVEACCAVSVLGWNEAYLAVGGDPPAFQYETKQIRGKEHLNGMKLIAGLLRLQAVDHLIIEQPPKRDEPQPPESSSPVENPLATTTTGTANI